MASPLMLENIWFNRLQVEEAEYKYYQHLANQRSGLPVQATKPRSLVDEIARARENIQSSLHSGAGIKVNTENKDDVSRRLKTLEQENENLKKVTDELRSLVTHLQARLTTLEEAAGVKPPALPEAPAPSKEQGEDEVDEDSESDDDLFGETDEKSKQKLEEIKKKVQDDGKKKKKEVIAKSNVILDVKPFSDETDMKELENLVREITQDGLLWGAAKLVPVAFGIKKLQISCVIEDEKVSVDDLEEKISELEDLVQSVDVAAFNKI